MGSEKFSERGPGASMNFCPEGTFKNWLIQFVAVATAGAAVAAASFGPVPESGTNALFAATR